MDGWLILVGSGMALQIGNERPKTTRMTSPASEAAAAAAAAAALYSIDSKKRTIGPLETYFVLLERL